MENQQKIVIRMSGWFRLVFLVVMAAVAFVFYITAADIFAKNGTIIHWVGLAMYAWMEIYFYQALDKSQKIVLDRSTLTTQMIIRGKSEFYPKFKTHQIELSEIQSVVIARIKYFKKHEKEFQDRHLIDEIQKEQISVGPASAHLALMYVLPKDQMKKTIVVRMAPFTRKKIMRLIRGFRDFGIPVVVEPALVTKNFL